MSKQPNTFQDLDALAAHLRERLQDSSYLLLFEPMEMVAENKRHFSKMLKNFMQQYRFNPDLFTEEDSAS